MKTLIFLFVILEFFTFLNPKLTLATCSPPSSLGCGPCPGPNGGAAAGSCHIGNFGTYAIYADSCPTPPSGNYCVWMVNCTSPNEANGTCAGSCTPVPGVCNRTSACNSSTCGCCIGSQNSGCNQGNSVCTGCNTAINPNTGNPANIALCCTDSNHFNCSYTSDPSDPGNGYLGSCNPSGSNTPYQCYQGTCAASDQASCNTGGGCQWTAYSPTNDNPPSWCATACSGGSWNPPTPGTCNDSCGNPHSCTMPPPPSWIQGFKVQTPGLVTNATTNNITVNNSPSGCPAGGCNSTLDINYPSSYKFNSTYTNNTISIGVGAVPNGYSVGYTKCLYGDPGCGSTDNPAAPAATHLGPITGLGCNNVAGCTAWGSISWPTIIPRQPGDTINLWFHFCDINSWRPTSACIVPSGTCGSGTRTEINDCGVTRTAGCTSVCTYFETYGGGNITAQGGLANYSLPAGEFVCRK